MLTNKKYSEKLLAQKGFVEDEIYYCIQYGQVRPRRWAGTFSDWLNLGQGNAFPKHEDAQKELNYRIAKAELEAINDGYKFTPCELNYYLEINYSPTPYIKIMSSTNKLPNMLYFKSREQARRAIDELGEDYLINKYFGGYK